MTQDAALEVPHSDLVYDFTWYPDMNSLSPETCIFLTTCGRDSIRLIDAYTGVTRATYRAFDHLERMCTAHSICFSPDGSRIIAGYEKMIRIFRTAVPGTMCEEIPFYGNICPPVSFLPHPTDSMLIRDVTEEKSGQRGIFSCICFNPVDRKMFAVASFSRQISISCEPDDYAFCVLEGQRGGVTHLTFSPDGNRLFSGGRRVSYFRSHIMSLTSLSSCSFFVCVCVCVWACARHHI
jgi:WD40 repeat protein